MSEYFQLDDNIVHLNHAAVAPWPVVTRDAVIDFADENMRIGSQQYAKWLQTELQLKQKMAKLINAASTDEIAILKNTSEGLSMIAQGLSFEAGDNIVIPAEEFPSNRIVWQALERQGIRLKTVSIDSVDDAEQALINALDEHTVLLSCSSVQFARGRRLDLTTIGRACRENGTLFCVDAIQSLGAVRFDIQLCHADFVVADGHKWMCGPEGTALFYCRRDIQHRLRLSQYGWHMMKNAFDFASSDDASQLDEQIMDTSQRFESGSPNMMGIAALNASLGLLLEIGIDTVESQLLANVDYLQDRLSRCDDIEIKSPTEPGQYAGIVNFIKKGVDNEALYQHLQDNDIICAYRGGGIRFAPHFYTPRNAMDRAITLVSEYG